MYEIFTANSKTEKRLSWYAKSRKDIKDKLDRLKEAPRKANGAHPLHGRLDGKWGAAGLAQISEQFIQSTKKTNALSSNQLVHTKFTKNI
ncbi:hypothetical protein J4233_03700 [Candidatus Pacearchaeota archaeon]|nr:hypothetical protein [Candidatus Pacearchaeota archaeon]